jgi:hypothetical protein
VKGVELELLFWEGCPSHPQALADLRAALAELGLEGQAIAMLEITSESHAARERFIGSPTIRINGVDAIPTPPDEPTGLTCRVYRRRDGRFSPTPDPDDLRAALRAALGSTTATSTAATSTAKEA